MKAKRVLRYTGLAFSILLAIWIAVAAAIYFFVDVDDVKKLAQKVVKENTKGELEIGDMRLKVFPLVYFEIDDLVFKSSEKFNREKIFACKESKLSFNLFSLIFGKPSITLKLKNPVLNITSDGVVNSVSDVIIPKKESSNVDVSKYLFISSVMFKIKDADMTYRAPSKLYTSKGLNMDLDVDPVLRSIDLETVIPIDAKDKTIKAVGKIIVSLSAKLALDGTAKADLSVDATKLAIETTSFNKPKSVDMVLKADVEANTKDSSAQIKSATVSLAGKLLDLKGKVLEYNSEDPKIEAEININPSSLEKLTPLFVALKDVKVSGSINSRAKIKGNSSAADITFSLDATDAGFKGASFQKPMGVPLKLSFFGVAGLKSVDIRDLNLIVVQELLNLKGKISGFGEKELYVNIDAVTPKYDVKNLYKLSPELAKKGLAGSFNLKAKVQGSLSKPVFDVNLKYEDGKNNISVSALNGVKDPERISAKIYSSYIDVNKYTGYKKTLDGKQKAKNGGKASGGKTTSGNEPVVKKESIDSIKKLMGEKNISLSAKMDKIIFNELNISNFNLDAALNKEAINISKITMNVMKSDISASFKMGLGEKNPTYSGKAVVKNLKAIEAVGAFFPSLKGVVDGVLTADMDFACKGYSINEIKKSLNGKGNFSFSNFRYSAQDMNKLLQEKIGDKIQKLGISASSFTLKSNPGWEVVEGSFTIANEKINIQRLYGKDKEYEVAGKGELTFDERMDMYLDFTVPYKNIPYEAIKIEGKDRSFLPLHLDGPAVKPRFDGAYTAKYLAEKAFGYEKKKLEAAAKKEAEKFKQKAQKEIQKAAEPLKGKLKDAIKGFKF